MNEARHSGAQARPRLAIVDGFPDSLLELPASQLWQQLSGPTLFQIEGKRAQPLFVSVLLHGNEVTGWQAVQRIMQRFRDERLPRSLLLFVGNIAAAQANVRTLPSQVDYNRTWPGTPHDTSAEALLMTDVFEFVHRQAPFASIDIHNNTGNNPHYSCTTRLESRYLQLARLFSRTVVYFQKPEGVQSAALARLCPSVTVECGRAGDTAALEHATEVLAAALAIAALPDHPIPEGDIDLMETVAILKVPSEASMSFDGSQADFQFRSDLDHLNFSELKPGEILGRLGGRDAKRLDVVPAVPLAETAPLIDYQQGNIRLARRAIPAMLCVDPAAVRLDCLGYLMHRIGNDGQPVST